MPTLHGALGHRSWPGLPRGVDIAATPAQAGDTAAASKPLDRLVLGNVGQALEILDCDDASRAGAQLADDRRVVAQIQMRDLAKHECTHLGADPRSDFIVEIEGLEVNVKAHGATPGWCGLDGWNSLGPLSMAERVETVGHSVAMRILRLADEIRAKG